MMSLHSINSNTGDTPRGRTVNLLKEAGDPPEKILHAQKLALSFQQPQI